MNTKKLEDVDFVRSFGPSESIWRLLWTKTFFFFYEREIWQKENTHISKVQETIIVVKHEKELVDLRRKINVWMHWD